MEWRVVKYTQAFNILFEKNKYNKNQKCAKIENATSKV